MASHREIIAGAYRVLVASDAAAPRYNLGDSMLVNPAVPPRAGDDVLLSRDLGASQRETMAGRLLRATATTWRLHLLNPERVETISRAAWPKAELIAGVFYRR